MELLAKVLPILILFGLGFIINKSKYLSKQTIDGFKKIVIDIALPSVLFIAFINLDFRTEHIGLTLSIFLLCIIMMIVGFLLKRIPGLNNPILPFVISGFTFGLLGIPLYSTVFGEKNLGSMAIMGIGHEFFIWFIYVAVMKFVINKERINLDTVKSFLTSPLIIAIVAGLGINILGFRHFFVDIPILEGIYLTIESMSKVATPLILIVVGYGLSFDKRYMKDTIIFVALRFILTLGIGYAIKLLLIDRIITFDVYMNHAFFTLLILPPPYSSSVLLSKYGGKDEDVSLANNITVTYTCLCIVVYIVYMIII